MALIRWGRSTVVGVEGLSAAALQAAAGRWCGTVARLDGGSDAVLRLVMPPLGEDPAARPPARVRLGARVDGREGRLELRVGPHAVLAGEGIEADVVRFGRRRPLSALEHDLVVDLGINHLLARQGAPVLHGGAFELGASSVLTLGESFAGKTTVAVAAMSAGGRVVSDDAVLAVPEGGRLALLPVRSYGWLRGRTREIVPDELRRRMVEGAEDGQPRWVLNREDAAESFVERSVPDVIWVQSVDRRRFASRIEPIDHGQVFAALIRASSPIFLSRHCPEIRDRLIPVFRSLCEQCRGYRVRLGRLLLEDPTGEVSRLAEASG